MVAQIKKIQQTKCKTILILVVLVVAFTKYVLCVVLVNLATPSSPPTLKLDT